ncbi:MAG: hypothetical protein HOI47_21600 [Candidatus Scalindua sp.]|jgi:hypothetical protein|nr:hypothetical protein [Candidatus Scalindua sp.]
MATYSTDAELDQLFHGIATTPGYSLSLSDFALERALAYDWVNDNLRDRYTVPFTGTVSKTIVMAEANYAVGMILKSNSTTAGFEFATYNPFFQEAKSLINKLRIMATGPDSSTELDKITSTNAGVEPTVALSKKDRDGNRLNPSKAFRKMDFY